MDATATATPSCTTCAREQEHCHDTLIVHVDGTMECSGGTCEIFVEVHEHLVPCDDVLPPCDCAGQRDLTIAA